MKWRARRVATTVAGLVLVALAAGACKDDGGSDATPSDDGSTTTAAPSTAPEVTTEVSFGVVTGSALPREARQWLSQQVRGLVDGWIDAAYVGGDYPRRDFSESWPGFTPGARDLAHRDRALMSNEDIGDGIDSVAAEARRVRIDVLAVRKRPVAVTAHVQLRFATTGTPTKAIRVVGRLYLAPGEQGWRVFGYDMTKGEAR